MFPMPCAVVHTPTGQRDGSDSVTPRPDTPFARQRLPRFDLPMRFGKGGMRTRHTLYGETCLPTATYHRRAGERSPALILTPDTAYRCMKSGMIRFADRPVTQPPPPPHRRRTVITADLHYLVLLPRRTPATVCYHFRLPHA